jgi:hypothetical protein
MSISNGSIVTSANEFHIGQGADTTGSAQPYAALSMSSGSLTSGSYLVVGFNNDRAVLNQSGGSITMTANVPTIAAGGTGAIGVASLSGSATLTASATGVASGGNNYGIFVGERGVGTLNVSGSAALNLGSTGLLIGPPVTQTGWSGTANLNGGTVTAARVAKGVGSGTATLNFNGGTLKASGATTTFLQGLDSAYIYGAISTAAGQRLTTADPRSPLAKRFWPRLVEALPLRVRVSRVAEPSSTHRSFKWVETEVAPPQ